MLYQLLSSVPSSMQPMPQAAKFDILPGTGNSFTNIVKLNAPLYLIDIAFVLRLCAVPRVFGSSRKHSKFSPHRIKNTRVRTARLTITQLPADRQQSEHDPVHQNATPRHRRNGSIRHRPFVRTERASRELPLLGSGSNNRSRTHGEVTLTGRE